MTYFNRYRERPWINWADAENIALYAINTGALYEGNVGQARYLVGFRDRRDVCVARWEARIRDVILPTYRREHDRQAERPTRTEMSADQRRACAIRLADYYSRHIAEL